MEQPNTTEQVNPEEWLEKLSKTKLYKLAKIQLMKEGKVEVIKFEKITFYHFDPIEVVLKGIEIMRLANNKRIRI